MLSTPLFTIDNCRRVLSIDNAKLLNFRNIRNLHLNEFYYDFPQLERPLQVSWEWTDWLIICRTLASMTKLRYLCISIRMDPKFARYRSLEEHNKLTEEFLKPLKAVKISAGAHGNGKRGQFNFVTKGWRVTSKLSDDIPFRILYEEN